MARSLPIPLSRHHRTTVREPLHDCDRRVAVVAGTGVAVAAWTLA